MDDLGADLLERRDPRGVVFELADEEAAAQDVGQLDRLEEGRLRVEDLGGELPARR